MGIVLNVADLRSGDLFLDVALIHADEAPRGPTTSPPTSPTTAEPKGVVLRWASEHMGR